MGQYIFGNKTSGVGRWIDRPVGLIDFLERYTEGKAMFRWIAYL